jgi:hypothetical protein
MNQTLTDGKPVYHSSFDNVVWNLYPEDTRSALVWSLKAMPGKYARPIRAQSDDTSSSQGGCSRTHRTQASRVSIGYTYNFYMQRRVSGGTMGRVPLSPRALPRARARNDWRCYPDERYHPYFGGGSLGWERIGLPS